MTANEEMELAAAVVGSGDLDRPVLLNDIALGPTADSAWAVGSGLSIQGQWHTLIEHPCAAH
jgi:hypothetical protein